MDIGLCGRVAVITFISCGVVDIRLGNRVDQS